MTNLIVYLVIAAAIALVDALPLYYARRPWRYRLTVFLQAFVVCLTLFYLRVEGLAWWIEGPAVGILLLLPSLFLPSPRGSYTWYAAVANAAVVGMAAAAVEYFLPAIAGWLA